MDWMARGREPREWCRSQDGKRVFAVFETEVVVGVSGEGWVLQTAGIRQ